MSQRINLTSEDLLEADGLDQDYLITVVRPDGVEIEILIPAEGDKQIELDVGRFGLNFITKGHYA